MIVLLAIYTYQCFAVFRRRSPERQSGILDLPDSFRCVFSYLCIDFRFEGHWVVFSTVDLTCDHPALL